MVTDTCRYVVVGCGLTSAWAVQGVREHDKTNPILLIGNEKHLPYERPPLSKDLWLGQKKVEEIFPLNQDFYDKNQVQVIKGRTVTYVDVAQKKVTDDTGAEYRYDKLLLATGGIPLGVPRRPRIPRVPGAGNREELYRPGYQDTPRRKARFDYA